MNGSSLRCAKPDVDVANYPPQQQRDRRYVPSDWRPPIAPLPDTIADITESRQDEFNLDPVMDSERERAEKERGDAYASAEFAEQVAATSEMQSHYQHNGLSRLRDVELSLMRSQYI